MTKQGSSRGRSVLVAVLGILACMAITISATTVWIHQTVLNTDRYVSVSGRVASDPQVIQEVSTNLATRITDGILERVDVPRVVEPLLESWIQEQIASFMASDAFKNGWMAANRAAHSALVRILRSDAVLPEEPVTVSVSQLLVIAFERLQQAGVIPDDVQLPDPSDSEAVAALRRIVAERLDIDLPAGFGEITLVRSERLEAARQVVRIFDIVTVVSILVAVVLVALTIWLARDRLRAVLLLGIGAAFALLAAVASTSVVSGVIAGALAERGATSTIGALVNALVGDYATTLVIVLLVGALTVAAILLVSRDPAPAEAMAVASPVPVPWASPRVEPGPAPTELPPKPAGGGRPKSGSSGEKPAAKSTAKPAAKPAATASTKPPAKPASKATRRTKGTAPSE